MKKNMLLIGACIILLGISGVLFWRGQSRSAYTEEAFVVAGSAQPQQDTEEKKEPDQAHSDDCAVYVSGAVKKPGLYRYRGNARVCDAIEAVGGFCENADSASINLARILEDGEQIRVLTKREAARAEKKKNQVQKDDGSTGKDKGESAAGGTAADKININTATAAELMTLPGIGEAKAALIINYREEHGKFSKIQDLMQISGIKEGIFQKIKNYITTS